MRKTYYSIGTARYEKIVPQALTVANAIQWLLRQQNESGTWAGPDALDEFISTTHSAMALMSVGFAPDSPRIDPAMKHLASIDKEKNLSFYWRSGAFLNLAEYRHIVREDAEYIWSFLGRVAVHRDYPVHFFLLKLLRFGELEGEVGFSIRDVLSRILFDWDSKHGWYDRTSITTMAVSLIYDLPFRGKREILEESVAYVMRQFQPLGDDGGKFSDNLVDDAFLVFNLCETDFLKTPVAKQLMPFLIRVVTRLLLACRDNTFWISDPPFGGSVTNRIYPTAVVVRALLSYYVRQVDQFLPQVASEIAEVSINHRTDPSQVSVNPFWGPIINEIDEDLCFVLMPFSPPKLSEIFERYVKLPIESLGLRCIRADDIYRPGHVMNDIWQHINRASVIVAELTYKNPNVFYELGMAHVLGKKVVLIAQSQEAIPFDLRGVRQILYTDAPTGYEKLARDIARAVGSVRNESAS